MPFSLLLPSLNGILFSATAKQSRLTMKAAAGKLAHSSCLHLARAGLLPLLISAPNTSEITEPKRAFLLSPSVSMNFKMLNKSYARREAWRKCHSHSKACTSSPTGTANSSHPKPARSLTHSPSRPVSAEQIPWARSWGGSTESGGALPALRSPARLVREDAEHGLGRSVTVL